MKQEKFKVIDFVRLFIKSISENLDNFPKKEYELKNRIKNNSYDILELAYEANSTEFIELKLNLINKMLSKVRLVDYLLDLAVDMGLLPHKKYIKLANRLGDIEKYSRGWMDQAKKTFTIYKKVQKEDCTVVLKDNNPKNSYNEKDTILLSKDAYNAINQISLWT